MSDQALQQSVSAWREARDKCRPGSKEWDECNTELRKAEAEMHKHRR